MSSSSLKTIAQKISGRFEVQERAREKSLSLHRTAIKNSGQAIRAIHRGEIEPARHLIADTSRTLKEIDRLLADFPEVYYSGFLQDAQKEHAEALITLSIIAGEDFPDPDEHGLDYASYLNGLAEAASELRRQILDIIRKGHSAEAERLLEDMDEIYGVLIAFDFHDAITGGLRRRLDQLRGVLERTRGDVTTSLRQQQLREALLDLEQRVGLAADLETPIEPDLDEAADDATG